MRVLLFLAVVGCTAKPPTPPAVPEAPAEAPATPTDASAGTDPAADADTVIQLKGKLTANPDDAAAHLGIATALSRLRSATQPCAIGATLEEILGHLEAAVKLDPSLAAKIDHDPDLAPVATTVRFAVLTGADLSQTATRQAVLEAADWNGPPSGVLPASGTLDLQAAGKVAGTHRALGDAGPVDSPFTGTWILTDTGLSLTAEGKTTALTLDPKGLLVSDGKTVWQNLPSECSA